MKRDDVVTLHRMILRLEGELSTLRTQLAGTGLLSDEGVPRSVDAIAGASGKSAAESIVGRMTFTASEALRYARRFDEPMKRLELRHRASLARIRKLEAKAKGCRK